MQKITKLLMLLIFISILFISVGYAAINSISLNISGFVITSQLLSIDIPETVFYYVGYTDGNNITKVWKPGDKAKNLVLHYDGKCNFLNRNTGTIEHRSDQDYHGFWSDLSGNGNDAVIVDDTYWSMKLDGSTITEMDSRSQQSVGGWKSTWTDKSLKLTNNEYVLCDFVNNGVLRSNSIPKGSSSFTYEIVFNYNSSNTGSKALIGSGYYHQNNEDQVWITPTQYSGTKTICHIQGATSDSDTNTYELDGKYRAAWGEGAIDNFRQGHVQKNDVDGAGNWTFNEATTWANNNLRTRYAGYYTLQDRYSTLYNRLYSTSGIPCPWTYAALLAYYKETLWTNRYNYTFVMRPNGTGNTSRALYFISNNTIRMEFWGNDNDVSPSISNGKHTLSVTYDSSSRKIIMYLDGQNIYERIKSTVPNTLVQEITVGAVNYSILSLFNPNTIELQFHYLEFLNDHVYSVRIYDRALIEDEIKKNFMIDDGRFDIK